jgi:hypothetical protein
MLRSCKLSSRHIRLCPVVNFPSEMATLETGGFERCLEGVTKPELYLNAGGRPNIGRARGASRTAGVPDYSGAA